LGVGVIPALGRDCAVHHHQEFTAMSPLRPAGFFARIYSHLFPRSLTAHVRTETLPNGQVEVIPVFSIDGCSVDIELIGDEERQTVRGRSVKLDHRAVVMRRETRGHRAVLAKSKAAGFLGDLSGRGVKILAKDGRTPLRIEPVRPDVKLALTKDDCLVVESALTTVAGIVVEKPADLTRLRDDDGWFSVGPDLYRAEITDTPADAVVFAGPTETVLVGDDVPRFLKTVDGRPDAFGSVERNEALAGISVYSDARPRARVDGDENAITISTGLDFPTQGDGQYELNESDFQSFRRPEGGYRRVADGWLEVTPESLLTYEQNRDELRNRVGRLERVEGHRIPEALTKLVDEVRGRTPWSVYLTERVRDAHRVVDQPADLRFRLNIVECDGHSLLELDPVYNHGRFRLTHQEAVGAVGQTDAWVRREGAWVRADAERSAQVEQGIRELDLRRSGTGYTFPAADRERVLGLFSLIGTVEHTEAYNRFLEQLNDFEKIDEVEVPRTLLGEYSLRPYQRHGYYWLYFLHRFGLNGILADDMGLGKSLMTLTILEKTRERPGQKYPSLIICPTSVVSNWRSEARKFFGYTNVITYTGSPEIRRARLSLIRESLRDAPLVVTSYDIARRDRDGLARIPWQYVIVDEGHQIKNPDAARSKAIKTIPGQHKLVLTGTPLQNNLEELWSLFDFLMPGYLGRRSVFRDRCAALRSGTRRGGSDWDAVVPGLKKQIHPFVLRRLKQQVARDLPTKHVILKEVELTPLQVDLYKKVLASQDFESMVESVGEKGTARCQTQILAMLAKLRNVCNHPVIAAKGNVAAADYTEAGKLACLKELMEEVIAGEHRALLFSQSTRVLDIIERCFKDWDLTSLRLDGGTAPIPANRWSTDLIPTRRSTASSLAPGPAGRAST
jgi:hypothetical protein